MGVSGNSKIMIMDDSSVKTLEAVELYTLSGCTVWCVVPTSRKLLIFNVTRELR